MNLLPDPRKQSLSRLYLLRVGVVGALVLSGVLFVHAGLALPTLVHWYQTVQEQATLVTGLDEQLAGSGEREVSARMKAINDNATSLMRTAGGSTGSGAVRAVVGVPHTGVYIHGLSFTKGSSDTTHKMTIVGRAVSRESLRSYATVLSTQPFVSSVDLPISAYAKESDIDFTITLTGTLSS